MDAALSSREQLAAVAQQLEDKVQVMHSQLMQLPALQQELKQLQEHQQQLEKDRGVQVQVRPVASSAA
jgi:prefoldin subunit 5